MGLAPADTLADKFTGIVICWAAFTALAWILSRFISHVNCEGSPRFIIYTNMTLQFLFLMPLPVLGWGYNGFEPAWLTSQWSDDPRYYETLMLYVTIGYCLKDFPWCRDFMICIHHVACITGTGLVLFYPHRGACLFCIGTSVLELGSFFTNIVFVFPTRMDTLWIEVVVMTLTNICAFACAVTMLVIDTPFLWKFYLVPCTCTLAIFRQKATLGYIATFREHGTLTPYWSAEDYTACHVRPPKCAGRVPAASSAPG